MKNIIKRNLDEKLYHADKEHFSRSQIAKADDHTFYEIVNDSNEQTPAMALGTAIHAALLEGKGFSGEVLPFKSTSTAKKNKEALAEAQSKNTLFLCEDQKEIYELVIQAAEQSDLWQKARKSFAETEISVFTELHGLPVRARFDAVTKDGFIVDLKTTSKPLTKTSIRKQFYKMNYDFQVSFYTAVAKEVERELGVKIKGFKFIFVSTTTGEFREIKLSHFDYARGEDKLRKLIEKFIASKQDFELLGVEHEQSIELFDPRPEEELEKYIAA